MKNAITGDTSQTFQRKFQELALAIRVEQRYTKDQILALYLNDVYFANGIYGIGDGGRLLLPRAGLAVEARRRARCSPG